MSERETDELKKQFNEILKAAQETAIAIKEIQIAIGGSMGSDGLSKRVSNLESKVAHSSQLEWKVLGACTAIGAILGVLTPFLFYLLESYLKIK